MLLGVPIRLPGTIRVEAFFYFSFRVVKRPIEVHQIELEVGQFDAKGRSVHKPKKTHYGKCFDVRTFQIIA